jgi:hypothetical protein
LGEEGLKEMMGRIDVPVDRLPEAVLEAVLDYSGGGLRDDVAMLALSLAGAEDVGRDEEEPAQDGAAADDSPRQSLLRRGIAQRRRLRPRRLLKNEAPAAKTRLQVSGSGTTPRP